MTDSPKRVLLTGATGFVGTHLYPILVNAGYDVLCATRRPDASQQRFPDRAFCYMNVDEPRSIEAALAGCGAAVYLIHAMAEGSGYEDREQRAAENFVRAAERTGVSRIVYLGGPEPSGNVSRHLRSRLKTGRILRSGSVSTVELQATMIVGNGSEGWRIVRDLAARLPFMILPKWLDSRSEPVGIDDVAFALSQAVSLEVDSSVEYGLPGPDVLSGKEILERTARLLGSQPGMLRVPLITPTLSSYWIRLVTRANRHIAEQLVHGLKSDLVFSDSGFWQCFPEHHRLPFEEAARRAIQAEEPELARSTRVAEGLLRRLSSASPQSRKA